MFNLSIRSIQIKTETNIILHLSDCQSSKILIFYVKRHRDEAVSTHILMV